MDGYTRLEEIQNEHLKNTLEIIIKEAKDENLKEFTIKLE